MSVPPWEPHPIVLANGPTERSPDALRQTLSQFNLQDERYKPGSFKCPGTRCNIFAWDATSALECQIPHWVMEDGTPVAAFTKGAHELSALGQIDWLYNHGSKYGWQQMFEPDARAMANQGRPVAVTWQNPERDGNGKPFPSHIGILLPTPPSEKEPRLAQAGLSNFFDRALSLGFGRGRKLIFWVHD